MTAKKLSLPPDSYMGLLEGNIAVSLKDHLNSTKYDCQPALMRISMESFFGDTWILGIPFLRTYYTVFVEGAHPRVFVSPATLDCQPTPAIQMSAQRKSASARRFNMSVVNLPAWVRKHHSQRSHEKKIVK